MKVLQYLVPSLNTDFDLLQQQQMEATAMTGEESSVCEPHQGGSHPEDTPLEAEELDQQGQEVEGLV